MAGYFDTSNSTMFDPLLDVNEVPLTAYGEAVKDLRKRRAEEIEWRVRLQLLITPTMLSAPIPLTFLEVLNETERLDLAIEAHRLEYYKRVQELEVQTTNFTLPDPPVPDPPGCCSWWPRRWF